MNKYSAEWLGWDRGREGARPLGPMWLGVLHILAKHEGEDYYNIHSPLYEDLERAYPDETWVNANPRRQFFRAYSAAWTDTGFVHKRTREAPNISLTALGAAVVDGRISQKAAILRAAAYHSEATSLGSENPFAVIALAFLRYKQETPRVTPLSLSDIYFGIESNWREGDGSVTAAIATANRSAMDATKRRRLRAILKVLTELDALAEVEEGWLPKSDEVLNALVTKAALDEAALASSSGVAFVQPSESLSEEELAAISSGVFDATTDEQTRQQAVKTIWVRRGQPKFRKTLLSLYSSRCAISRYDATEALEAAHIVPISGEGTHSPQNGLLLRADLHTLFDLQLIGIEPHTYRVIVGSTLKESVYKKYDGVEASVPLALLDRPSAVNLKQHLEKLR